jgi:hypothetical protein
MRTSPFQSGGGSQKGKQKNKMLSKKAKMWNLKSPKVEMKSVEGMKEVKALEEEWLQS